MSQENPVRREDPYLSPLTDRQHELIGKLVVVFGYLEGSVDFLIMKLAKIKTQPIFSALVDNRSISSKADLLAELSTEFVGDEDVRKNVLEACKAIKNLVGQRNTVVHGQWGTLHKDFLTSSPDGKGGQVMRPREDGVPAAQLGKKRARPFLASDLERLVMETNAVIHDLLDLSSRDPALGGCRVGRPLIVAFTDRPFD